MSFFSIMCFTNICQLSLGLLEPEIKFQKFDSSIEIRNALIYLLKQIPLIWKFAIVFVTCNTFIA